MVMALLVAGIGCVLAGLAALVFGIPNNQFGLGNTLILVGTVGVCAGLILIGLSQVVQELKLIARRLGSATTADQRKRAPLPALGAPAPGMAAPEAGIPFGRDPTDMEPPGGDEPAAPMAPPPPPPWHEEAAARDRVRVDTPAGAPAEPTSPGGKPRRNLLFSSVSRKERERAAGRAGDAPPSEPAVAPPVVPPAVPEPVPPASFDEAWPKSERGRGEAPPRRAGGRAPSTFEPGAPATGEEAPPVTVLKSGVVDGMAYSLYSDGSIEAQMPEGMMRFASIDELRAHLDQRPS
ncbi:DUF308 domain-containing protein [Bradyrhizobium sp. NP1]|uniref:DUF308 domain-containing protein n=1 Tax=Bradyrhizobium sp. NP1 TaxID=3049772 RepID=UPI0025A65BAC|nr:DUF308 domain-containing protein [Bradyrhizobium sp. NP1]WJR80746.1 DUF308 domain-containing protein [Bradyrhizobium sp. NP1]